MLPSQPLLCIRTPPTVDLPIAPLHVHGHILQGLSPVPSGLILLWASLSHTLAGGPFMY